MILPKLPFVAATVILILISLVTDFSKASVWEAPRNWNSEAETEYTEWVQKFWIPGIFSSKASRYYGIPTDCADASYSMRAIFAFEHGLPFAVRDNSAIRERNVLSNHMERWDSIRDPLTRFKAFLYLIHNLGSTQTLPNDTFPVALQRQSFRAGIIMLFTGTKTYSGHTMQVADLNQFGLPRITSSTVPRRIRELSESWRFPNYYPTQSTDTPLYSDGYRRFKTPDQLWQSSLTIPEADLEQFKIAKALHGHNKAINDRFEEILRVAIEPFGQKGYRLWDGVCKDVQARALMVAAALRRRSELGSKCMNEQDYESLSTPSRDYNIEKNMDLLKELRFSRDWSTQDFKEKRIIETLFDDEANDEAIGKLNEDCELKGMPGGPGVNTHFNLRDFYKVLKSNTNIWDPNSSLEQRWGLAPYKACGAKSRGN